MSSLVHSNCWLYFAANKPNDHKPRPWLFQCIAEVLYKQHPQHWTWQLPFLHRKQHVHHPQAAKAEKLSLQSTAPQELDKSAKDNHLLRLIQLAQEPNKRTCWTIATLLPQRCTATMKDLKLLSPAAAAASAYNYKARFYMRNPASNIIHPSETHLPQHSS